MNHTTGTSSKLSNIPDLTNDKAFDPSSPLPFCGNYFCTWGRQGGPEGMNEENMFGEKGVVTSYPTAHRSSLIVVYDDGWDIPFGTRNPEEIYRYGKGYPDPDRFPSTRGMTPPQAMKWLVDQTKRLGFAGAGVWIAMQISRDSDIMYHMDDYIAHWTRVAKWANEADVAYWKVDWGQHYWNNAEARENLTKIVRRYAPRLLIEHAHVCGGMAPRPDFETTQERLSRERHVMRVFNASDYYRTYDCNFKELALATTLHRMGAVFANADQIDENNGCRHIFNTENELYAAAALGCTVASELQHPVLCHQYLAVERVLQWQRFMPPFSMCKKGNHMDQAFLTNAFYDGNHLLISQSAPARFSRNCPLPTVHLTIGQQQPFVLCAVHPQTKAAAVYAAGRVVPENRHCEAYADITVTLPTADAPIAVFGSCYRTLTLQFDQTIEQRRVFVQDLAQLTEPAYEITNDLQIKDHTLTLTRAQIETYGNRATYPEDESDPGLILYLR